MVLLFLPMLSLATHAQETLRLITLSEVIDILSLKSIPAKIELLNFQNEQLLFENYRKSLLPSLLFNVNPINFNRSLRVLQKPTDGSYSYVEDFSNTSNWGITIKQKVGFTGGELSVGTQLVLLNEFSQKRNSFSTSPFTIGYSQQLWGEGKTHRLEKKIEYAKSEVAAKYYCSKLSEIQQEALNLFMATLLSKLQNELEFQNKEINDTLLYIAQVKLNNGNITDFDFKQIELQLLNTKYAYENAARSYEEALRELETFLALKDNLEIAIPEFDLPLTINFHTVSMLVRKNNPYSIQQLISKLEAEKTLHSIKLSGHFNGNVSLNYGMNQYADNFIEAYRHGNSQQSIMLKFQIPIFQWGIRKNKLLIAQRNYQISLLNQEKSQKEFDNQIIEKVNNYNHSIRLWLLSEKAYAISQKQYHMLTQKFRLGKVSVYELTSAQRDQNAAMQQYYTAIRDVYKEYYSLRHLALFDWKYEKELVDIFF